MGLLKWTAKTFGTLGISAVNDVAKAGAKGAGALAGKDVDVQFSGSTKRGRDKRAAKELKKQTKLLEEIARQNREK